MEIDTLTIIYTILINYIHIHMENNQQKGIPQTGLLFKINPTDFITGASPLIINEVMPTGDWRPYAPTGEKQYKQFTFDSMSCTTFSALNIIETWVNYLKDNNKFTIGQLEIMNKLGFFADGKFNCSDRFTAIMSGTMPNGNYFQNVWDSIRRDGLLPEALLPFNGNSWAEYHDKSVITEEMKATAQKIKDILEFSYEWLTLSLDEQHKIAPALKQCPVQGAIPAEATHAIEVLEKGYYFDTYEPFIKALPAVKYSLKGIVTVKKPIEVVKKYKYFSEKEVSTWKLKPELFEALDKMRELAGTPFVITSGYRTPTQNENAGGVKNSAHLRALAVDLLCTNNEKRTKMLKGILGCGIPVFLEIANKHLHIDIDTSIHTMGDTVIINDD